MTKGVYNVLFLCVHNSARSLMAEAILRSLGGERFRAYSAGIEDGGDPDPQALLVLREAGHDTTGLRSKPMSEFEGPEAPALDFLFTLCDRTAGETCPVWAGQPVTAHWGLPDPTRAEGNEAERALAYLSLCRVLERRMSVFTALPIATLDHLSLLEAVKELDEIEAPQTTSA